MRLGASASESEGKPIPIEVGLVFVCASITMITIVIPLLNRLRAHDVSLTCGISHLW